MVRTPQDVTGAIRNTVTLCDGHECHLMRSQKSPQDVMIATDRIENRKEQRMTPIA
jgi:hypothetical protein